MDAGRCFQSWTRLSIQYQSHYLGVLTQFAIVIGLMITQAIGLRLATPHEWRIVLIISSVISIGQLLFSPAIVETPSWLHRHGLLQEKAAASRKLWTVNEVPRRCKFTKSTLLQSAHMIF